MNLEGAEGSVLKDFLCEGVGVLGFFWVLLEGALIVVCGRF